MKKTEKKVKILRICICAALIVLCIGVYCFIKYNTPKKPENIVLAVLPDTQLYSEFLPEIFDSQTQWIADHKESENISFVLHVGDIVNRAYIPTEWENASNSMAILDAEEVPFVAVTGNHDVDCEAALINEDVYYDDIRIDRELYPKYFPKERFAQMETFGEMSEDGYNQYHILPCGDGEIMIMALDWMPSERTMKWVEDVLNKNADIPTIIVKHDFIYPRKKDRTASIAPANEACEKQWEVFSKHNQIFMIINGHYTGSDHGIIKNSFDNDVYVAVVDYQSKYHGGNGWMRLLTLDFENNTINGVTFSPFVMQIPENDRTENDVESLRDEYNEFQFPFNLQGRFDAIWN